MSLHNIPLTDIEKSGLEAHKLAIGEPSQLSDSFRAGIAWALNNVELGKDAAIHVLNSSCDGSYSQEDIELVSDDLVHVDVFIKNQAPVLDVNQRSIQK